MLNFTNFINNYLEKNDINNEQKNLILKTTNIANIIGEDIFTMGTELIIDWCFKHSEELNLVKNGKLLSGYQLLDWITWLNIEDIKNERIKFQNLLNDINKQAILTDNIKKGDLDSLKSVVNIQKNSNDNKEQKTFVYMNFPSLFDNTKEKILDICPNCQFKFVNYFYKAKPWNLHHTNLHISFFSKS